jgi:hypothetical protein
VTAGWLPGVIRCSLGTVALLALAGKAELQAQAGLSSGVARVALIARAAPHAWMSPAGSGTTASDTKELAVKVHVSANTGYKLVAVGTAPSRNARLWVRDSGGEFRELTPGAAITVARDPHAAGEWLGEVRYRSERARIEAGHALPVRYEIRVDPAI